MREESKVEQIIGDEQYGDVEQQLKKAIRTAPLTTTAAAMEPHTALGREKAGLEIVCAIRRRTAGGNQTDALTKIIKIKRLMESKLFP